MATIYGVDGFAYSDGDLAGNSHDGGGTWATCASFANLNVATNRVKPNTGGNDGAAYLASWAGSATEQWAQLTIPVTGSFIGPTLFNNGVGDFYFFDVRAADTWRLYRVVGGSFTEIATASANTSANNDVIYLEAKVNGSQVDCVGKKNGSTVLTFSDTNAARLTSGTPGMRMWHADAAIRIDDFSAGDFSTGGAVIPVFMNQYRQRRN